MKPLPGQRAPLHAGQAVKGPTAGSWGHGVSGELHTRFGGHSDTPPAGRRGGRCDMRVWRRRSVQRREDRAGSLQLSGWRGAAPGTSAHSGALGPGPRGAGTQPSAWVSSEHKEGRRCQHPWGLAAAKANSGGGVEDTAWAGRGKMGQQPRSPPGASRAGAEAPPDEGQRGQRRSRLKAQRSENKDPGIRSHHFMANRWGNRGNGGRL